MPPTAHATIAWRHAKFCLRTCASPLHIVTIIVSKRKGSTLCAYTLCAYIRRALSECATHPPCQCPPISHPCLSDPLLAGLPSKFIFSSKKPCSTSTRPTHHPLEVRRRSPLTPTCPPLSSRRLPYRPSSLSRPRSLQPLPQFMQSQSSCLRRRLQPKRSHCMKPTVMY